AHNNAFNHPELAHCPVREPSSKASLFFQDEHEPEWLMQSNTVPDPFPEIVVSNTPVPSVPEEIRQRVGRVLEGRFRLSAGTTTLLNLLNAPETSPAEITQAVMHDPNFATRILRIVNSAQFGLAQPITAVGRAVVLLGFNNIRSITMAHMLSAHKSGVDSSHLRELWLHSAICSACAASIAKKSGSGVEPGDAATIGLLVDIGKMLMKAEETGFLSTQTGVAPSVIEGFAGSCFAESWGLPVLVRQVLESLNIAFHYPVERIPAEYRQLTLIVALANFITRWYGFSNGDAPEMPSREMLDAIGWHASSTGHWVDPETALEMEKARTAVQVYFS
ncbi:MAG TPA: HDOD domain-containing protein, partial [Fibrobacteraceae bacterium]|nr:HDOD domain-containing protein [Fibrobacteraceae bacterium]